VVMTWWTSRSNGTIPVLGAQSPKILARWQSQVARYCRAPPRRYSCSTRMARDTPAGRLGWHRHLLIRRDHVLVLCERGPFELPGVQVEHPGGLGLEVGVPGEHPGPEGPGADGVLGEPPPDRELRDAGYDAPADHLVADVGEEQTGQGNLESSGKLAGDGLDLNYDPWGGNRRP